MATKNFTFSYQAFDESTNQVYKGNVICELTERNIKGIAQIMQEHGGFPVEMSDLKNLSDQVWDDAIFAYQDIMDDVKGFDISQVDLQLDEKLPQELLKACEPYIIYKTVNCLIYYLIDGKEKYEHCRLNVSPSAFNQMVEVAQLEHNGMNDFELLKERYPETYLEMIHLAQAWIEQWGQNSCGTSINAYLKDFPYQVYEAI